ncbi:MAG: hypothetical protein ABIO70_00215 [Pseudomonadota bacterium]
MDLSLSLLSPAWWATVLVCTILLTALSSLLARRRADPTRAPPPTARRLRLATWTVTLLVLANLAMLGTLLAVNLPSPRLAGPVGLSFLLCCLVSLVLAVLVHGMVRGP